MSDANELLRINLHEVMSDRCPERRRAAIEQAYVGNVRHLDSEAEVVRRSSRCPQRAAVDDIVTSVYRCGATGCEERDELRNLFRFSGTTDRDTANRVHDLSPRGVLIYVGTLRELLDHAVRARRFDKAGRNSVDPHPFRTDLIGEARPLWAHLRFPFA